MYRASGTTGLCHGRRATSPTPRTPSIIAYHHTPPIKAHLAGTPRSRLASHWLELFVLLRVSDRFGLSHTWLGHCSRAVKFMGKPRPLSERCASACVMLDFEGRLHACSQVWQYPGMVAVPVLCLRMRGRPGREKTRRHKDANKKRTTSC